MTENKPYNHTKGAAQNKKMMKMLIGLLILLALLIGANIYVVMNNPGKKFETPVGTIQSPKNGNDGKDGDDGQDGKNGLNGQNGSSGSDGLDGRDGRDGVSIKGDDGKDGLNGLDGKDGINGVDGQSPVLRCNKSNHSIEYKYPNDTNWIVLLTYNKYTATCGVGNEVGE